jgi:hypothetical protein
MKRLIIARKYMDKETLSTWIVFDENKEVYRCVGLELPWLGNQKNISCIPEGKYICKKYSDQHHPNSFLLLGVLNRTEIMIHPGNFGTGIKIDTEGCLLPGIDFQDIDGNGQLDVIRPDVALLALNYFLPKQFDIIIL